MSFTPAAGLTAESSRVDICRLVPDLFSFHQHRHHFHSKRWRDQYNAITSYAADRAYPKGQLPLAYAHYRQRTLWSSGQGSPHPNERPYVKAKNYKRRRSADTAHSLSAQPTTATAYPYPCPSSPPSFPSSSTALAQLPPWCPSSLPPALQLDAESDVAVVSSALLSLQRPPTASATASSMPQPLPPVVVEEASGPAREAALQQQLDALKRLLHAQLTSQQQLQHSGYPPQRQSAQERAEDQRWGGAGRSRYHRLHEDTIALERLFKLYHRLCGPQHNADADREGVPEKRARRAPGVQLTAPTPSKTDCVSVAYAECTRDSFDKLCQLLAEVIEPPSLRMSADSVFLDIGSGYGKCVVQARWRAEVRRSIGIEYLSTRHEQALRMLLDEIPPRFPKLVERLRVDDSIELLEGDATTDGFAETLAAASHIFMFDTVFSARDKEALLEAVGRHGAFRVLVCCQPPREVLSRLPRLRLVHQMKLKTSRQTFCCYLYTPHQLDVPHQPRAL